MNINYTHVFYFFQKEEAQAALITNNLNIEMAISECLLLFLSSVAIYFAYLALLIDSCLQ